MRRTKQFWDELEERMEENKRLAATGGLPHELSGLARLVGLRFWKVGVATSLVLALGVWWVAQSWVLSIAKALLLL